MRSTENFHTTRWTLVHQSRGDDTASQQALSDLCAEYYQPVVAFIQRSGFDESAARDMAHDFFTKLLGSPQSLTPDRARGRFRSYLLGTVKHFVSDALDHQRAAKRGGAAPVIQWTDTDVSLPEGSALTPDRAFDRQWALMVIERVLRSLANEFERAGRADQFALLKPWLTGDDEMSQHDIAERLGINEGAVKVSIHRLRKRFRELMRAEIAQTLTPEADVREELAHLLSAM